MLTQQENKCCSSLCELQLISTFVTHDSPVSKYRSDGEMLTFYVFVNRTIIPCRFFLVGEWMYDLMEDIEIQRQTD
jgi:hypothetical protein